MYRYQAMVFIILIILVVFCESEDPNSPQDNRFAIQVDSIQVASTVHVNDTLTTRFWGMIGPNLCYQFSHFEVETEPFRIAFALWGDHPGDEVCAQAISELRGQEYRHVTADKGWFSIVVYQPDQSTLTDSVLVI